MNDTTPDPSPRNPRPAAATPTPPEDPVAYRIAVGAFGVSLVAFLIGGAVIAAGGKPVPTQYWTAGTGLSGALLGILAPTPTRARQPAQAKPRDTLIKKIGGFIADTARDVWNNRAMAILMVVFGVSLGFGIANNSSQLESVAAAAGGALIGLLAPPPKANPANGG